MPARTSSWSWPIVGLAEALSEAMAATRERRSAHDPGVVLRGLAAHSEKQGAAGTYKGGFGLHPLLCDLPETGAPLAGILRPGDTGANTAAAVGVRGSARPVSRMPSNNQGAK